MVINKTNEIGIGLIGSGYMGRCHANAFKSVNGLFDLPVKTRLAMLADIDEQVAKKAGKSLMFEKTTGRWMNLIESDEVDLIAIATPNELHEPMASAAAKAGKIIYCEKPISTSISSAKRIRDSIQRSGVINGFGFNYIQNPMIRLAKEIIESREIGEIMSFRGWHRENYMSDPAIPHSFRTQKEGGGALFDLGSHVISIAHFLVGEIDTVQADSFTYIKERYQSSISSFKEPVIVDDHTISILQFSNGAKGFLEVNWCATGRTMDLGFEISGTHGCVCFSQENFNELKLYRTDKKSKLTGFTKIEAGPEHKPYGNFCVAGGHQLGFNDLKVIEVSELLSKLAGRPALVIDAVEAFSIQKVICTIEKASLTKSHEKISSLEIE